MFNTFVPVFTSTIWTIVSINGLPTEPAIRVDPCDTAETTGQSEAGPVVSGVTSRGGQLRCGVAASRGEWVMVLHSDTILQDGWAREVQKRMHEGPLCFSLAFRAPGIAAKLVAAWANLRTDVLRLPYGDQGLLLRHKDYDAAGGYLDQPLMEDVALVCALAQRVRRIRAHAFTGAKKISTTRLDAPWGQKPDLADAVFGRG